jgi:prepilin-type N-terminal cleavage/methylation domain-containing protein
MSSRKAFSLIEVIVVIAIIAILIGLLLPAIQRVREAAAYTQSSNNMRQILMSVQNFASVHNNRVPVLNGDPNGPNPSMSLHHAILPYIEQGAIHNELFNRPGGPGTRENFLYVKVYLSPADPSLEKEWEGAGQSSYAANAWAFQPGYTLAASYSDGLTNTIAFAEHYAFCGRQVHHIWVMHSVLSFGMRRASFADNGGEGQMFASSPPGYNLSFGDVYPVTKGSPPVSGPSNVIVGPRRPDTPPDAILQPIKTPFQTAPAVLDCHGAIPQTPHRSGMLTGLMDGSIRKLAPSTPAATFWGAVTPNGGEILADW